jgi:hypothetical protein
VNEARARLIVRERAEERCELCGMARGTNFSHRVSRGQGGLWTPANGQWLCGSGTTGCHGRLHANPDWAYRHGLMLRRGSNPTGIPVLYRGARVLLDDEGGVSMLPDSPGAIT